jgi:putative transposase
MKVQKGYKFKLNPTEVEAQKLRQFAGSCRFLYNHFVSQEKAIFEKEKKFIWFYDLAMSLPDLKKEFPFLKEADSQALQFVAKSLDLALKDIKRKGNGFPVYKSKHKLSDSFTVSQRFKVYKKSVHIPKIGKIKWKKHRDILGLPKKITISQDGNSWFCSVTTEQTIPDVPFKTDNIVGIDVGLKVFATLSDGTVIENPRHLKLHEKTIIKKQRNLSHKVKNGKNRKKAQLKLRKEHRKVRNIRRDFLHKTSDLITKNYDGVVVEDLNIEGMMKNHRLAKGISDVSWSEFSRQLEYKGRWRFKSFKKIDRYFPSSKTCSTCGNTMLMPLDIRIFDCSICGLKIDRDLNAAINIKNFEKTTAGTAGCNACGDVGRLTSMKQEKICLDC